MEIYISDLVCNIYNKKCNPLSLIFSNKLIKMASVSLLNTPEQSILELVINSIDSYNLTKPIGKFKMGFFSILYWLINNERRFIEIISSYVENDTIITYNAVIEYENNAFILDYDFLTYSELDFTGTTIILNCENDIIDTTTLEKIYQQILRLLYVENIEIYIKYNTTDFVKLNNVESNIGIYITLSNTLIIVSDEAAGISIKTLKNSLLIPFKKDENTSYFVAKPHKILQTENSKSSLVILVNDIILYTITINEIGSTYLLYVENDFMNNIKVFEDQIKVLINDILIKENNIYYIIELLKKYSNILNSPTLTKTIFKVLNTILNDNKYLYIPNYWDKNLIYYISKLFPIFKLIIASDVNIYNLESILYSKLYVLADKTIFLGKYVIFIDFYDKNILIENYDFISFLFINSNYENAVEKSINYFTKSILKPYSIQLIQNQNSYNIQTVLIKQQLYSNIYNILTYAINIITDIDIFEYNLYLKLSNLKYQYIYGYSNELITYHYNDNYINNMRILNPCYNLYYNFLKTCEKLCINHMRLYDTDKIKLVKLIFYKVYGRIDIIKENKLYNILNIYKLKAEDIKYDDLIIIFENTFKINKQMNFYRLFDIIKNKFTNELIELSNYKYLNPPKSNTLLIDNMLHKITSDLFINYYTTISFNNILADIVYVSLYVLDFTKLDFTYVSNNLIIEIINGLNKCVENSEYYIYLYIVIIFVENYAINNNNYENIGTFLITEIRKELTLNELNKLIINYYTLKSELFIDKVNYIYTLLEEYYYNINNKPITESIILNPTYTFKCNSLISFIFENNIDIENENILSNINSENIINSKINIVDIAVNELSNISFIQNILSLLIVKFNSEINFYTHESSLQIKINHSNSKILEYLIPFITSDNLEFFNIYKQPYIRMVNIVNINNNIEKIIEATPIIIKNKVIDIQYIVEEKIINESEDELSIYIHFNIDYISELFIESLYFIKNYSFLYNIVNIYLNDERIKVKTEIIYETTDVKVLYLTQHTINTVVILPDGEFISLSKFVLKYNIIKQFVELCENSIVLKITGSNITSELINNCLYCAILTLYINDYYINPDLIIMHASSQSRITQLDMLTSYTLNNKIEYYNFSFFDKKFDIIDKNNIAFLINDYILKLYTKKLIFKTLPNNTIIDKVLIKWFKNKNIDTTSSNVYTSMNESASDESQLADTKINTNLLLFISIYWNKIKDLINNNTISILNFNYINPIIYNKEMPNIGSGTLTGYYTPSVNKIYLNSKLYNAEKYNTELIRCLHMSLQDFLYEISNNNIFNMYFSTIKISTLIHELGHAFNRKNDNSSHGLTTIKFIGGEFLLFSDMVSQIYLECIKNGLFIEYYYKLKEMYKIK